MRTTPFDVEVERGVTIATGRGDEIVGQVQTRLQRPRGPTGVPVESGAKNFPLARGAYQDEGDIVYCSARDRSVAASALCAGEDDLLRAKLQACIERIDRDEVSIVL